jgi:general secretion pathway protein D
VEHAVNPRLIVLAVLAACAFAPLPASAFAAEGDPAEAQPTADAGDITFDWKNVPITVVVQAVLGDLLQTEYEIAPGVEGTVTYKTPRPVGRWEALALLEQQLAANGAMLVDTGRGYLVQPVAAAGD